MMTAAECQGKAHDALAVGATALTPEMTAGWEAIADQWVALAAQADVYESLRRDLLDRTPAEDTI